MAKEEIKYEQAVRELEEIVEKMEMMNWILTSSQSS